MAKGFKTTWVAAPQNWQKLKHHPYACIIEFGAGIDLDSMAAQMREHGYDESEPIVLWQSDPKQPLLILSGRHRHAAAIMAEVMPAFRVLEGDDAKAQAFALKDVHRRHLNESQRALIAARLSTNTRGGDRRSDQRANLPFDTTTQEQAASTMGVSETLVKAAAKVDAKGTPALVKAVADGTLKASDAASVADLPKSQQNAAVQDVLAGRERTASSAAKHRNGTKPKSGAPIIGMTEIAAITGQYLKAIDNLAHNAGLKKGNKPWEADSVIETPDTIGFRRILEELKDTIRKWLKKIKHPKANEE